MRKNPTPSELLFGKLLLKHNIIYRSQRPIVPFIVDFLLVDNSVVVEIDGGYHKSEEQRSYDLWRTRWLERQGLTVVRILNEDINQDLSWLKQIKGNKLTKLDVHMFTFPEEIREQVRKKVITHRNKVARAQPQPQKPPLNQIL